MEIVNIPLLRKTRSKELFRDLERLCNISAAIPDISCVKITKLCSTYLSKYDEDMRTLYSLTGHAAFLAAISGHRPTDQWSFNPYHIQMFPSKTLSEWFDVKRKIIDVIRQYESTLKDLERRQRKCVILEQRRDMLEVKVQSMQNGEQVSSRSLRKALAKLDSIKTKLVYKEAITMVTLLKTKFQAKKINEMANSLYSSIRNSVEVAVDIILDNIMDASGSPQPTTSASEIVDRFMDVISQPYVAG